MTLHDLVKQALEAGGFDGLYYPGECACKKDDLFPCGDPNMTECRPGFLHPCESSCGEHDWHIGDKDYVPTVYSSDGDSHEGKP